MTVFTFPIRRGVPIKQPIERGARRIEAGGRRLSLGLRAFRTGLLSLLLIGWSVAVGWGQSQRPGMGAIPYQGGVTFRVWAPNASSVSVRGDFNSWGQTTLLSEGNGNWSMDLPQAQVGHQFKYFLNGNLWKRDPRARSLVNSAGNSIVYDPNAFDWGESSFVTPWRNDLVIYQMHVGTFSGGRLPGTFDRAIQRLDHLKDMGVNAIKLMPINEFAGAFSWGYNPSDLFAIESSYGGADGFKRFVKACHQRGIAVLVDVVHNHYGPSDLDMWRFDGWSQNGFGGIYFYNDNRAITPWGDTRPDFGRSQVRDFIRDQIFMWLEEYRVDGFRWDSIYNMRYVNGVTNSDGTSLIAAINWEMQQKYPEKIRIAEDHAFDTNVNFHSQWDVAGRWTLHGQVVAASDAGRNMSLARDFIYGQGWERVVFSEAHDYIAAAAGRSRIPTEIDPSNPESLWARKRALLATGLVMTSRGIPMIHQGQEMHETEAFADATGLRWERAESFSGIVRAYKDLIHLRRNLRGVTQGLKGNGTNVHHLDNTNKVIGFIRWDAGGQSDDVVVVANFSNTVWNSNTYQVNFPSAGTWYSHFNSDAQIYQDDFGNIGAVEVTAVGSPPRAAVNMGRYSLQIFSKTPPPIDDPWQKDSNSDGIPDGWYLQYGFNPLEPSVGEVDSDGDGFTNRQEYLLGTDPTNPASRFRIVRFDFDAAMSPRLEWSSVGGRTYVVERSDNLKEGYSPLAEALEDAVDAGVETSRVFIDSASASGGSGFRSYRVRLKTE
jgi:1,4-alpha-glucan branching enzyme